MAAMSDYVENKLVDFLLRGQTFTPPSTVYVGLFTATPSDTGGGTEVSGGSYARVAVASSLANWSGTQGAGTTTASSGTSGTISNNIAVVFPLPTAAWGVITHTALFDAATGGNEILYGALVNPKTVNQGDSAPTFQAGALAYQIDN